MSGLVTAAEKDIATLLAKLETDTGSFVEHLKIVDIEVTTFEDTRPKFQRRVVIEMKRMPGSLWGQ